MADWRDSYLVDFLKQGNARIESNGKWLIWDIDQWRILHRPYGAKFNKCLYAGDSLQEALEILKR